MEAFSFHLPLGPKALLGGRFGYFLFFLLGGEKGSLGATGRGRRFFIENPREGVSPRGGGEGAGRVCAGNWGGG